MNRIILLLMLFSAVPLFATDETEPEEPGIVLPTTLLEVADLQVDEISALIPEEEIQLLPELNIPLPKADEIFLPDEQFDVPFPDQLQGDLPGVIYRPERRADIFSEGEIAVGTMNHVRGDLSLYRLGPDPKFDLRFYHDKIDGYGPEKKAGAGYFHSEDILEGTLSSGSGNSELSAGGGISERSDGLQQDISSYESVTSRRVYAMVDGTYPLGESGGLTGRVSTAYAQQILSSPAPVISDEIGADASIGIGYRFARTALHATLWYSYQQSVDPLHTVGTEAELIITPNESIEMSLTAGAVYDQFSQFLGPFNLSVAWDPVEAFGISLSGGYFYEPISYGVMAVEYPFAGIAATLPAQHGWVVGVEAQGRILRSTTYRAGTRFTSYSRRAIVASTADGDTGLYAVATTADQRLDAIGELGFAVGSMGQLSFTYNGRFLSSHPYKPDHNLSAAFTARGASDAFGGKIKADIALASPMQLPELGISAYYRLSESVQFGLVILDTLAPLIPDGRSFWDNYEAPGFRASLSTKISL